jgi:peptidoglycan/LPS O-acetylase OafA/YrhL
MGFLRLVLAVLVMLSHLPDINYRNNYGQMAVLIFYFISGYLMAMVYARFKAKSAHPNMDFYLDRVFKLWPSYLLVMVATIVVLEWTGIRHVQFREILSELFILPNAYGKFFQFPYNGYVIPPTWSLGVEVHFYLIVPLLAALTYRTKIYIAYALTAAHLTVLASTTTVGDFITGRWPIRTTINQLPVSDYIGFDLPFIIVVVFLFGSLAYEKFVVNKSDDPHLYVMWSIYAFGLFFLFPYNGWIRHLSASETLLSITCFIPIALALLLLSRSAPPNIYDRIAGALSYPLFLTHFLAMYIVGHYLGPHAVNARMSLQSIALALILAAAVAVFQVGVADRMRYSVRGFGSSQPGPTL